MFNRKKNIDPVYPPEVVATLEDLMRYEYLVQAKKLLPSHPVYSILAGRHASKLRGRGMDFEEVRQYVPGDDIRNIDWHVTARTGKPHSKVFNEEKERPTYIIVDQSAWMFFGSERYVKSVSAAHAAALGAFYTIKRGDRTGGLIFNEEGYDHIAPKRSKMAVQHFLQCIVKRNKILPERKRVEPNTNLLNDMLKRASAAITHDYVITIISDFTAIDEQTKQYLRNLSNHNDVILIHIYDPLEEALPDGRLILGDGKHQIAWKNNKRKWGEKYEADFQQKRHELSEEFRRYRIPIMFFNTVESIEDQVMHDFAKLAQAR